VRVICSDGATRLKLERGNAGQAGFASSMTLTRSVSGGSPTSARSRMRGRRRVKILELDPGPRQFAPDPGRVAGGIEYQQPHPPKVGLALPSTLDPSREARTAATFRHAVQPAWTR
jgi:hypothetical protein